MRFYQRSCYVLPNGMLNNHSYVKGKLLLLRSKAEPPEDKWELQEKGLY